MNLSRRGFMSGLVASSGALASVAEEKILDGGFAEVSLPGVPDRRNEDGTVAHILPPGAKSYRTMRLQCVGCQLCVKACPEKVLRMAPGAFAPLPVMGFEKGWCRSECTRCGEVCPAQAIRRLVPEQKKNVHMGRALFNPKACLALTEGISCSVCMRRCPSKAITQVPQKTDDPKSVRIPLVNELLCTGCGACENLCPARPLPALVVKGYERAREIEPRT